MNLKQNIAILMFAVLIQSCDVLDKLTQFDIPVTETITIAPTLSLNVPFSIPTPPIELNTATTFETNETHKDLIQEIYLSKLRMSIISPIDEDFSMLKSIEIYILAEGMTEKRIAWKESIDNTATSISLEVSESDLKEYLLKDKIELKVKTVTDEINTHEIKIKIDANFKVNAKLIAS